MTGVTLSDLTPHAFAYYNAVAAACARRRWLAWLHSGRLAGYRRPRTVWLTEKGEELAREREAGNGRPTPAGARAVEEEKR